MQKSTATILLTNGVVAVCKVVGGIFLPSNQLLRVEQLVVSTSANLINNGGLQVDYDTTRHVLASTHFGEECVESIVATTHSFVTGPPAIGLNAWAHVQGGVPPPHVCAPLPSARVTCFVRAATNRVEDHEALQSCAIVGTLADTVEHQVNDLLTNGVVAVCKVVGGIFLPSNQLLRVEQLVVSTSANLINNGGLQVDYDTTRHVLANTHFSISAKSVYFLQGCVLRKSSPSTRKLMSPSAGWQWYRQP